jgi:N-acetylneuraminic acid mutarotase
MQKLFLFILISTISILSQEQAWVQMASLPPWASERHHPVTFSIDGKGYLLGGANPESNKMFKDFYVYNPTFDDWTQLDDYPGPPRGFGYGVVVDGKAYVGTGIVEGSEIPFGNDLWEFDPETLEWTELASLPEIEGRFHPAFVGVNGKIFVGAGAGIDNATQQQANLKDFWEYDIAKDEWRQLPDIPGPARHHPYYFGIGNDVYITCGHGSVAQISEISGNQTTIYNDLYKWDSELEQWTKLKDFPGERRVAGTQFSYGGKGYLLSGEGEDHDLLDEGEFWEYDPATEEWTQLESHAGNSRWAPGNFIISNKLFFTSGRSSYRSQAPVYEKDLWMYELPIIASVEEREDVSFDIYPNPSSDFININGDFKQFEVEIVNTNGNSVLKLNNQKNINISDLAEGMYIINITFKNQKISKNFVKIAD